MFIPVVIAFAFGAWAGGFLQTQRSYRTMTDALTRLKTEVTETRTVMISAITLITGLGALIRSNIGNEDALNALADDLDAQQRDLAEAISANTPTEGASTPTPTTGAGGGSTDAPTPAPGQIGGPPLDPDAEEEDDVTDAPATEAEGLEAGEGPEPAGSGTDGLEPGQGNDTVS